MSPYARLSPGAGDPGDVVGGSRCQELPGATIPHWKFCRQSSSKMLVDAYSFNLLFKVCNSSQTKLH